MNSSEANALSKRVLFCVDRAGFPAIVMRARTWPSPGVSISSTRVAVGSSPNTSGNWRTRLRQRPKTIARPGPRTRGLCADIAHMAPPARSRFPVRTLTTSTSQLATVPNWVVVVPMRP
jgi:hypothetical protein